MFGLFSSKRNKELNRRKDAAKEGKKPDPEKAKLYQFPTPKVHGVDENAFTNNNMGSGDLSGTDL